MSLLQKDIVYCKQAWSASFFMQEAPELVGVWGLKSGLERFESAPF